MSDVRPDRDHAADGAAADPAATRGEDDAAASAFAQGVTLLELGRPSEAREAVARGLAREADDPDLRQLHATARLAEGDVETALQEAGRLAADAPDWARPHEIVARAHLVAGRAGPAAEAAREAVRLEPEGAEGLLVLGAAELAADRPARAIEAGRAVVRRHPESVAAHLLLGDAELAVEEPLRALGHYDAALALDPEDATVHNNRGVAMRLLGREDEAQRAFATAGRLDPAEGLARSNYADSVRAELLGRWIVPTGGFLLVWGAILLALPPAGTAGLAQVVLGGVLLAGGLLRARRREARLGVQERRAIAGDRWWERLQLTTWRPWFVLIPAPWWLGVSLLVLLAVLARPVARGSVADVPWLLATAAALTVVGTAWRTWRRYVPRWSAARARRR